MSTKVHDVIKLLSAAFRKNFDDYMGLYLFGSYIDGQEHEEEDIEIVALFGSQNKSKRETIWPIVGKIETELQIGIDLYPYTDEEFKNDENLYNEVMENGIYYNQLGITKRQKESNQGI